MNEFAKSSINMEESYYRGKSSRDNAYTLAEIISTNDPELLERYTARLSPKAKEKLL